MTRAGANQSIPPPDRAREQIAVRRSETQRRWRYGGEPPPIEPSVHPVFLSFREAIAWIVYGKITALEGDPPGTADFFQWWKWKSLTDSFDVEAEHPLASHMRSAIARVRQWQRRKRQNLTPPDRLPPRLGFIERAHVRWAIRHHGGVADRIFNDLCSDVEHLREVYVAHWRKVDRAIAMLCAEIAAGNIVAWGRPGVSRTRHFNTSEPEPIPPSFFANEHNTIRLDGWATCAPTAPSDIWTSWAGQERGDVKVLRVDVLRLAPLLPSAIEVVVLTDLHPWLAPMQAAAWIVSRDAAVTLRASLDTADIARASGALGDTSDWCDDRPGLDTISIDLRARQPGAADNAIADLVAALRREEVVAAGIPCDPITKEQDRRRKMTALDWADLTLCDEGHGARRILWYRELPGRSDRQIFAADWLNILIETTSLLKRWPPHEPTGVSADLGRASTPADHAKWRKWLAEQMRATPTSPQPKAEMRKQGLGAGLPNISDRGFDRAWANASQDAGAEAWSAGGRRKK